MKKTHFTKLKAKILQNHQAKITEVKRFFQKQDSHSSVKKRSGKFAEEVQPFKLELFSTEHMKQHSKAIAAAHRVTDGKSNDTLLSRLDDNEKLLLNVHSLLIEEVKSDQRITPAGEWILDNFYFLEEQIRTTRMMLPKGYSRELPHLVNGASAGLPRVYDIALEIIAHCDGSVKLSSLKEIINAYQSVTPLKLGELWAVPIMLRLALIENIRRLAALNASYQTDRTLGAIWAGRLIKTVTKSPKDLILRIADMARSKPNLTSSFVAEFTRRLRGMGSDMSLPFTWLEQQLAGRGQSVDELINTENQEQAANQVSISNCISSLRTLASIDWKKFVESLSTVEQILSQDPAGIYCAMDFSARDRYRHEIERIARKSKHTEDETAILAVNLAKEGAAVHGTASRMSHVGYYLIAEGIDELEKAASIYRTVIERLTHILRRRAFPAYTGSISIITLLSGACFGLVARSYGVHGWSLVVLVLMALLASTQLAVAVVNWLASLVVKPKPLPRMDFSEGIPEESRTLVIVPAMLSSRNTVEQLFRDLEIRFLANREENLHFALVTDYSDAATEHTPQDQALLELAVEKTEELNKRYPGAESNTFYLFHRPRKFNPAEGCWMGYERKRGKISELNAVLRGREEGNFSCIIGDKTILQQFRYVITLDADTQLPRDAARLMVEAMAHPLNRPLYDEKKQRVVAGYGILQPRIAASLSGAGKSVYARMNAGEIGIDPYTRTVSDVYQDLFGEGSFIGKGIYDIATFDSVLEGRFPENKILSHDLIEGCYVRSGILSDVQLYEDPPPRYSMDAARRHRWARGDWQIMMWAMPYVPCPGDRYKKNPVSLLSRWKIVDNMRRCLFPFIMVLLLFGGWLLLPDAWLWTVMSFGLLLLPVLVTSAAGMLLKSPDISYRLHFTGALKRTVKDIASSAFYLACIPYEALSNMDAMVRTAWRMHISKKLLLQWNIFSNMVSSGEKGESPFKILKFMWMGPFLAVAGGAALAVLRPSALPAAIVPLLLWLSSPVIVWWVSRPLVHRKKELTAAQNVFLTRLARKIWDFFEVFVSEDDNWLPPDNHQQNPVMRTAHRTSPTNIGLSLLANLSALDFGFLSTGRFMERTANTLATMEKMERYRGHFYNWYDTQSLCPLPPRYISTVDSGNLSGHLLVLYSGIEGLKNHPVISPRLFEGLSASLSNIEEAASAPKDLSEIKSLFEQINQLMTTPPMTPYEIRAALEKLEQACHPMTLGVTPQESVYGQRLCSFHRQLTDVLSDLALLAPWSTLSETPQEETQPYPDLQRVLTLEETARLGGSLSASISEPLKELVEVASAEAERRLNRLTDLARTSYEMSFIDYSFLYDKTRHLLTIGYNVDVQKADLSFYDLLASEARLGCFIGIAQGQLPQESWFTLGRSLTNVNGKPILLSWSGSMFEYLMPPLVMPSYEGTLLDETCKAAVRAQIDYGKQRNIPWGISESGYNVFDARLDYQYRAFGVPGIGIKRGLAEDLVIAPYATVLALLVNPKEACANIDRLTKEGFQGDYGLYEAVDYTPSRLPRGETCAIVKSFMAHHQGMSLVSLNTALLDRPMQKRFEDVPELEATMLLLQERVPEAAPDYIHTSIEPELINTDAAKEATRIITDPLTPKPEIILLSNGRYHVLVSSAGGGYSRWNNLDVTRWREDGTRDSWGSFLYLRDLASGDYRSVTYQPTKVLGDKYEAIFSEGRAEFRNSFMGFECHTEIVVSPEDDIELRRIKIKNRSRSQKTFDITSYAEAVLASGLSDALHPVFSNLFLQTEIVPEQHVILCTRRPRYEDEFTPVLLHMMTVHGAKLEQVSFETDRSRFIGRQRSLASPEAMDRDVLALSGSEGSVLDPIVAIRSRITLEAGQTVTVDLITGVSRDREAALVLAEKYRDRIIANRVFHMAWTHSQVLLRQLNATEAEAQVYNRLASSIVYSDADLRADKSVISQNIRGQSGLWGYSISGDLPIVLLQVEDSENIDLVRRCLRAHAYWRQKGLAVDLVIWNEDHSGYRQHLHDQIMGLIIDADELLERPGGVFIRSTDRIAHEDRVLIQTVARVIIRDAAGTLEDQLGGLSAPLPLPPQLTPARSYRPAAMEKAKPIVRKDLQFFNGLGGFAEDGREYVIATAKGQTTPAPWVNVIANPYFGTVVSESGLAYTWSENAREFRITPWANDPVSDSQGEAYYLRDEEDGYFWSPTSAPAPGATPYTTRHGFGYSTFEHTEHLIETELCIYVAIDAPVKYTVLKIHNLSDKTRVLSAYGYVEWVLGDLPARTAMHIVTETDTETGAILARNPYNMEFTDRTAFFDTDDKERFITCDRREFLGRFGSIDAPAALKNKRLSGKTGAALDPCGAIQVPFKLEAGETRTVVFRLGAGRTLDETSRIVKQYRGTIMRDIVLDKVKHQWSGILGAVQVETPDEAFNVMLNGWLLYQTIACRLWARSGNYQSGGAFGFRDQLQDAMATVHSAPHLLREQILLCAAHQFVEGDVLHWWHPPVGRGVRTQCSDDYLWLPVAVCRYIDATGDAEVLGETIPYLTGRPLNEGEESYYDLPAVSSESGSLYDHCKRSIYYGLKFGVHGLPLMGCGDWNDGMNLVGNQGRGESVWLGFFLYDVLLSFAELAVRLGDSNFKTLCEGEADKLRHNTEANAWDGAWYRRAYFDDGTPLGSALNDECTIDSIAQSWSVISGAGDPDRSRQGMEELYKNLVNREDKVVQLFTPPFDKSDLNPGYIKGYVPGVRENGGQYTHGAIWAAMAFALLGDKTRAWELFNIINPFNHGRDAEETAKYKVEPYVIAADVYANPRHSGRGGWSWYTGSAAWMYRFMLEALLGISLKNEALHISPCLPAEWRQCTIRYRYKDTLYILKMIQNGEGCTVSVNLDGVARNDNIIPLINDSTEHSAIITVG